MKKAKNEEGNQKPCVKRACKSKYNNPDQISNDRHYQYDWLGDSAFFWLNII
jgi:hypothetical protein